MKCKLKCDVKKYDLMHLIVFRKGQGDIEDVDVGNGG